VSLDFGSEQPVHQIELAFSSVVPGPVLECTKTEAAKSIKRQKAGASHQKNSEKKGGNVSGHSSVAACEIWKPAKSNGERLFASRFVLQVLDAPINPNCCLIGSLMVTSVKLSALRQ
jgi:hypothetical protein